MSESGRFQVNITLNGMKNGEGRVAPVLHGRIRIRIGAAVNLPSGIVFFIQSAAMRPAIPPPEFRRAFREFGIVARDRHARAERRINRERDSAR